MGLNDILKKAGKKLKKEEEKQEKKEKKEDRHAELIEKIQRRKEIREKREKERAQKMKESKKVKETPKEKKPTEPRYKGRKTAGELFQEIEKEEEGEGGFHKEKEEQEAKRPEIWDWPDVHRKLQPKEKVKATTPIQEIRGGPEELFSIPTTAERTISHKWEPPNLEKVDKRYALVEPWAYTRIKWDESEERLVYNVLEPPLTEEEEKKLKKINELLSSLLDVNLINITEKGNVKAYLDQKLEEIIRNYEVTLTASQYDKILYYIYRNFLGLEKIEPLMHDPNLEDISCDGVGIPLYVYHRKLGSIKTNLSYDNSDELDRFITKLAQRTGKHISVAEPLLQGALPDGSRLQATYSAGKEIAKKGSTFTIRKFTEDPLTIIDQMNFGTIPALMAAYLWLSTEYRNSLLISGGTAVGKTAALNSISMFIPQSRKILSVEDTPELNLPHEHWISKIATSTGSEETSKSGEVSMFDLIKAGLRERPDQIIVGEVRGKEAYNLFQGMSTGHPGLATMHAESIDAVINRLKTPPINLSPGLLQHLDIIIILGFSKVEGIDVRRAKKVVEVVDIDLETGRPITNELFNYIPSGDYFEFASEESYVLKEIQEQKGISKKSVWEELKRRKSVLNWMQDNDITGYRKVGKIISQYYNNPEKLLEKVEKKEGEV